jgi:hypothetical protein
MVLGISTQGCTNTRACGTTDDRAFGPATEG